MLLVTSLFLLMVIAPKISIKKLSAESYMDLNVDAKDTWGKVKQEIAEIQDISWYSFEILTHLESDIPNFLEQVGNEDKIMTLIKKERQGIQIWAFNWWGFEKPPQGYDQWQEHGIFDPATKFSALIRPQIVQHLRNQNANLDFQNLMEMTLDDLVENYPKGLFLENMAGTSKIKFRNYY